MTIALCFQNTEEKSSWQDGVDHIVILPTHEPNTNCIYYHRHYLQIEEKKKKIEEHWWWGHCSLKLCCYTCQPQVFHHANMAYASIRPQINKASLLYAKQSVRHLYRHDPSHEYMSHVTLLLQMVDAITSPKRLIRTPNQVQLMYTCMNKIRMTESLLDCCVVKRVVPCTTYGVPEPTQTIAVKGL